MIEDAIVDMFFLLKYALIPVQCLESKNFFIYGFTVPLTSPLVPHHLA